MICTKSFSFSSPYCFINLRSNSSNTSISLDGSNSSKFCSFSLLASPAWTTPWISFVCLCIATMESFSFRTAFVNASAWA
jgi:hypothetical protein